jgi:hypothetical protein
VQVIPEEDEHKFDFDLLDSTKFVPVSPGRRHCLELDHGKARSRVRSRS